MSDPSAPPPYNSDATYERHPTSGLSGTAEDFQSRQHVVENFKQTVVTSFPAVTGNLFLSSDEFRQAAGGIFPDENVIKQIKVDVFNCSDNHTPAYVTKIKYGDMAYDLPARVVKEKGNFVPASLPIPQNCKESFSLEIITTAEQRKLFAQRSQDPYLRHEVIRPVARNDEDTVHFVPVQVIVEGKTMFSNIAFQAVESGVEPIRIGDGKIKNGYAPALVPINAESLRTLRKQVDAGLSFENNQMLEIEFLGNPTTCITLTIVYESAKLNIRPMNDRLEDKVFVEDNTGCSDQPNIPVFVLKTNREGKSFLHESNTISSILANKKKYKKFMSKNSGMFADRAAEHGDDMQDVLNDEMETDTRLAACVNFIGNGIKFYTMLADAHDQSTEDEHLSQRFIPQENFHKHLRDDDEQSTIDKMIRFIDACLSRIVRKCTDSKDAPFPLDELSKFTGTDNPVIVLQNIVDYGSPELYKKFHNIPDAST